MDAPLGKKRFCVLPTRIFIKFSLGKTCSSANIFQEICRRGKDKSTYDTWVPKNLSMVYFILVYFLSADLAICINKTRLSSINHKQLITKDVEIILAGFIIMFILLTKVKTKNCLPWKEGKLTQVAWGEIYSVYQLHKIQKFVAVRCASQSLCNNCLPQLTVTWK